MAMPKERDESDQEELQSWKEILADAFAEFFLTPPVSAIEAGRRALVVLVLVMLSGGTYTVIREPGVLQGITGAPVSEQTLSDRLNPSRERVVGEKLEEWFYSHRPNGLMLVAWDTLRTTTGIWLRPEDELRMRAGIRDIGEEMRVWAGPFIFGECVESPSEQAPNLVIVACPVYTESDVHGYVAAVVNPSEVKMEYIRAEVRGLARWVTNYLYRS
jgi:hypothetical protein